MLKKLALLFTLGLVFASGSFAQKNSREDATTRTVEGIVSDANDKPVDKAIVQLKDMKTLQIRSFITHPDGGYHFAGLSTNVDYELRAADQQGVSSNTKRLSVFDSRKSATIDLKLAKAK